MFNICPQCGEDRADKTIEPEGPHAVCPNCNYRHKFVRLPLFVLTGASGVGKTATCIALAARVNDFVPIESDILLLSFVDQLNRPATNYREYREVWLRVCKNISQAGKPVLLCGVGLPTQFEQCVERRYFSEIFYLALVCDDELIASHLRNRAPWPGGAPADERIRQEVPFNRWLKANARTTKPPMSLLDTTDLAVDRVAEEVRRWVGNCLSRSKQTELDQRD